MKKFYAIVLAIGFLTMGAVEANGSSSRDWSAPSFTSSFEKSYMVLDGQQFKLSISFSTGGANTTCVIYRNDTPITVSSRFQISFQDGRVTLLITEVFYEDAGVYTFKLTNALGTASASTRLIVI